MADVAWQGQSGILNEDKLGNDREFTHTHTHTSHLTDMLTISPPTFPASWIDHARDLLHLTNVFRAEMPRPIIGVGHSFGGNIIVNLALMHPRLLSALVMIDPVLTCRHNTGPLYGFETMRASSGRRDLWPSREEAERGVRKNRFYSAWDPRAVDRLVRYGFRECPTSVYPDKGVGADGADGGKEVTLTSTKHMECFTFYRPTQLGPRDPVTGKRTLDRSLIPDATDDVDNFPNFPFYQPMTPVAARRLPELRPGVVWIVGEDSPVCPPETNKERMEVTGYGVGGSGGARAGRVKEVVVGGTGHLVAMEKPGIVASNAAGFIKGEVEQWRKEEDEYRRWVDSVDDRRKAVMDDEFLALIKGVGPEADKRRDESSTGVKPRL